jgi:hypothetical protein
MPGMPLYSNMSDEDNSDERFSDEMARSAQRKSHRSSDGGGTSTSEEDSGVRKSKKKSKKKSKRPSSRENMTEEELMAVSARRKRESKMAASGVVAPEGRTSSRELEDPREGRRSSSRHSGSGSTQNAGLEGGIDKAVDLSDEEDPFVRSGDPLQDNRSRSAPKPTANTKKKQEINKDFKDVRETGRWGSISTKEKWVVGIVALLVIIGVVVAVVVTTVGGNDEAPAQASLPAPPTAAPTARIVLSAQEQLSKIRAATEDNPATIESSQTLPDDVSFYQGQAGDSTAAPVVRAASWIMYDDPIDNDEWLIPRYGLSVLYYATNGTSWTDQTGWMTEVSACEWTGIRCDRFNKVVEEIDLSRNNLVGSIPNEVSLVKSLISLWLRKNELSGTVPNVALGSIPQLSILYLDSNNLQGSITADLAASGSLKTLFIQENDLTGFLPIEFCPERGVGGLLEFGIDCSKLECFCCYPNNCF